MTKFETIQPLETFEHAGALAYRMQILRNSNPYPAVSTLRGNPRDAWDRGYMGESEIDAFKERARVKVVRKPFKRTSNGPKFSPVSTDKGRRNVGR